MNPLAKTDLSHPRQRVVELLQHVNFGKVDLLVQGAEPILDPRPRIIETRKMGAPNGPRAESELQDFGLKQQLVDLFQTMDEIVDGNLSITVRHGLPCLVEVERQNER